jgi:hypothetical protein
MASAKFFNMFSHHASSADELSDCESETAVMIDGRKLIRGENGTYMLSSTGNALLDVFSSSTRIDGSKPDASEVERFKAKLMVCLEFHDDNKVDAVKYYASLMFYLRDIKEKGERTLFDIAFIKFWEFDSELAKSMMKFIVGSHGTEYFGSWKDLKQILDLAKTDLSEAEYSDMYRHFIRFEGEQLASDWNEFVACKSFDGPKAGQTPHLSLIAKWTVSAGKHFDEKLEHGSKSYVANFCEINSDLLAQMSKSAYEAKIGAENGWKRTVKSSDYIGLQRVLRKVKSTLNAELDTPEQKMCAGKWSEIKITNVPARNMTKHRRAFNNEKAERNRKSAHFDIDAHPDGDRYSLPDSCDSYIEYLVGELRTKVTDPDFATMVSDFWKDPSVVESCNSNPELRRTLDRIICRFKVTSAMIGPDSAKKSIHGARSDLNDLVTAAWKIRSSGTFDPSNISEWAGSHSERALLHTQIQNKIKEISDAIDKAIAEQDAMAGTAPESDTQAVRINLKKTVGLYDVSTSMESGSGNVKPMDICVGLAYCISQFTCDKAAGRVPIGITFETSPRLFNIPQNMDFVSALHHIKGQSWGGSTDLQAAYRLLLNRAIKEKWSQADMPECMMVLSDMQINQADARSSMFETTYETLKREFKEAGYDLPLLVFWNLNGKYAGQSVGANCPGVVTISGFDPAIFKTIAECGSLVTKDVTTGKITMASPMEVMIKSLSRERYQPIHEVVTQYYNPIKEVAIEEAEIARLVLEDLESGSVLALATATATTNK